MLTRYPLTKEEEGAVRNAIGVFAWTSLAEGRMKNLKRAQVKSQEKDIAM